jgi:hypothetical protein
MLAFTQLKLGDQLTTPLKLGRGIGRLIGGIPVKLFAV